MEVGGGEEKRLGGSCAESFLNEGVEQYRAMRGIVVKLEPQNRKQGDLFLHCGGRDLCKIVSAGLLIVTPVKWSI